ncbi:sodium/potassium/calcium exchanger 4-like [Saccoglossus kowalevskii]|uniref:Sodium/potassium/calcium exchanger 3-like n=1 Tax=Saccoglossus kowalevskii TaxID=10224 RepID=A0ABM0M6X0_SACKO|nr:PREDICTED: sodium/potassium/calcium exchanger 3-like [Saccoglossus kowalevskii]
MRFGRVRPRPRFGNGERQKEYREKKRYLANVIRVSLIAGCVVSVIAWSSLSARNFDEGGSYADSHFSSRSLLQSTDAGTTSFSNVSTESPPSSSSSSHVSWESCDYESAHYAYLWVILYLIIVLIIFVALAIICDDFFVPSLEVISEKLELSEDVAGATFMAAGSSAPELFTSVAGVVQETDLGIGTIVGSAVFNILIIIALSAALAGQILHLDWRPLMRDSLFYGISICCFITFSWDAHFELWESIVLLVLYVLYIVIMKFNHHFMNLMDKCACECCSRQVVPIDAETGVEGETDTTNLPDEETPVKRFDNENNIANDKDSLPPLKKDRRMSTMSTGSTSEKHIFHHVKHGELSGKIANKRPSIAIQPSALELNNLVKEAESATARNNIPEEVEKDSQEATVQAEEEEVQLVVCPCLPALNMNYPDKELARQSGCCGWFKYFFKWILFIVSFPFVCLFTWTIPNCGKPHLKKWFLLSFTISVVWIMVLSFVMVTIVQKTGCLLNINAYAMGLVIVAMGTSIPDALSSILVARDGYGDMAVSNAIGSNVFDINLGLGLPFVIRIAIDKGKSIYLFKNDEGLTTAYENGDMLMTPHSKFGFILLLILVITQITFIAVRFRLNKYIGIVFVSMYVLFLVYAFIQEFLCDGYKC